MALRVVALTVGLLLALVVVPAAPAKEGVRATVVGPAALDARPGEQITIAWRLSDADGHQFGADGLFVRLRNPAGDRHTTAFTEGSGRFSARIRVPEGGIGRIEFGLRGWTVGGGRTSRADMLFPIENYPFTRASAGPIAESTTSVDGDRPQLWHVLLAVGVSGMAVVTGVRISQRSWRSFLAKRSSTLS